MCHASILSFGTAPANNILLLQFPCNQGFPNVYTVTSEGTSTIRTCYPIGVCKRIETNLKRSRVKKSMTWIAFDVTKNLVSRIKMYISRSSHELTKSMYCKGDIRSGDRQVEKTTNQSTIASWICKLGACVLTQLTKGSIGTELGLQAR